MAESYEDFVETTDLSNHSPIFYIFGMLEEAGEIAGICKRCMRGDYGEQVKTHAERGDWEVVFQDEKVMDDLVKETGDKHWYGTRLLQEMGINWKLIETVNTAKLAKRKETGKIMGKGDTREDEPFENLQSVAYGIEDEDELVICPQCKIEGLKSTVVFVHAKCMTMEVKYDHSHYDENGRYHNHNHNLSNYKCSNNHEYSHISHCEYGDCCNV